MYILLKVESDKNTMNTKIKSAMHKPRGMVTMKATERPRFICSKNQ